MNTLTEIENWLKSGKNIETGLRLFHKYNNNNFDKLKIHRMSLYAKSQFIDSFLTKLYDEKKGVNQKQVVQIEIVAKKETAQNRLQQEFARIRFSELPDTLKLLVFQRFDAWECAIDNYRKMQTCNTNEERFLFAKKTVLAMQENWSIWEELNYFHKYTKILGKHDKFKEDDFLKSIRQAEQTQTTAELTKMLISIRTRAYQNINEYKRKSSLSETQTQKMEKWIWKFNIVSQKLNEPLWQ